MTILAIAGMALMRTLLNTMEASRLVRDTAKAVFLTQSKLHELEIECWNREGILDGETQGYFEQEGAEKFQWHALIEKDRRFHEAYIISVWTTWDEGRFSRSRVRRSRYGTSNSFMLKTMVPMARYNEQLVRGGGDPGKRGGDRSSRGGDRGRGGRGGRR